MHICREGDASAACRLARGCWLTLEQGRGWQASWRLAGGGVAGWELPAKTGAPDVIENYFRIQQREG